MGPRATKPAAIPGISFGILLLSLSILIAQDGKVPIETIGPPGDPGQGPTDVERVHYQGLTFTIPRFGHEGFFLSALPRTLPAGHSDSPILRDMHSIWDTRRFAEVRQPLRTGTLVNRQRFHHSPVMRTLDMPIKFPGTDYRIPRELVQFREAIQRIIDYEHAANRHVDDYYAYLTIDQGFVRKGVTQRNGGAHVDGFQGARNSPKVPIDHSYTASTAIPTLFYVHPFETSHLDERVHNFFLDFERQADRAKTIQTQPYGIYVFDAYTVHEAQAATEDTFRTFLRLSYSVLEFDRLGSAHNPLFDYSWDMAARETLSRLVAYVPDSPRRSSIRQWASLQSEASFDSLVTGAKSLWSHLFSSMARGMRSDGSTTRDTSESAGAKEGILSNVRRIDASVKQVRERMRRARR